MTVNKDASVILLTYKGKILLLLQENSPIRSTRDVWTLLSGVKNKNESFEDAIVRKIKVEMQISVPSVEFLSNWNYDGKKKYFYRASLTDQQVNNILREEGQAIGFFSLQELAKLPLENLTKLFIAKHRDLLENLHTN